MNSKQLKITGIILVVIVVLNLILFSFTVISWKVFLAVLIVMGIFAYLVLPKMKK